MRHITIAKYSCNRGLSRRRGINITAVVFEWLYGRGERRTNVELPCTKIVECTDTLKFPSLDGGLLRNRTYLFQPTEATQVDSTYLEIARAMQNRVRNACGP